MKVGEHVNPNESPYGWLIKRIAKQMEQNINQFLKPYNITSMQSWILLHLDAVNEARTFKELEKQFEVSQPTMVGILARLEQKDFVVITNDSRDKRIKKVSISKTGIELISGLRQHLDNSENKIVAGFSNDEMNEFHHQLEKAYYNIIERDGE